MNGDTAPAQPCSGTAWRYGNVMFVAIGKDAADLFCTQRLKDGFRHEVAVLSHLVMVIVGGYGIAPVYAAGHQIRKELKV